MLIPVSAKTINKARCATMFSVKDLPIVDCNINVITTTTTTSTSVTTATLKHKGEHLSM